jgi:hypothetical protein
MSTAIADVAISNLLTVNASRQQPEHDEEERARTKRDDRPRRQIFNSSRRWPILAIRIKK